MQLYEPGASVDLCLQLEDEASTLFPRAYAYRNGTVETTVDLAHVALGRYTGAWSPATEDRYDVIFRVFEDAPRSVLSPVYTTEKESWVSLTELSGAVWDDDLTDHTLPLSAGLTLARLTAARAANLDLVSGMDVRLALVEKILRNRLELTDGDTANWVLYDDDSVTPLLTWDVSDKDGDVIQMNKFVPARRTRGA